MQHIFTTVFFNPQNNFARIVISIAYLVVYMKQTQSVYF